MEYSILFYKLVIVFIISCTVAACNSTSTQKVAREEIQKNKITKTLYLSKITFSQEVADNKFKTQCSMLEKLKDSILSSSQLLSIKIRPSDKVTNDQYEVKENYINVVPHRWAFPSVRPSSNATIKVSILKQGVILHSTTKLIGSAVSFGACDRLDKIAIAQGRFVSKWVRKYI